MRHVVFLLDKDRYALPLSAVRELVVPPRVWSRVPRAPPSVRGVINLRGRVVTVVELGGLLGLSPPPSPNEHIVLLDKGRKDLGLLVSDVEGIESIEKVGQVGGKRLPAVRGVARLRGVAVTVLDPEAIDGAVEASFSERQENPPAARG